MKIVFLQLVHPETDDRIVHQMGTLRKQGHACVYARTRSKNDGAEVIICDTPKAVLRNIGYGGRVVYDVTEWYPSKKNLRPYSRWMRPFAAVAMVLLSVAAGICADRFIFGEKDKGKPFRWLFPWKKYVYLPYYPSRTLFEHVQARATHAPMKVLYAGPLTEEKGYFRAVEAAKLAGVELTVIGPEQYMPLDEFCHYISDFDVALDLRDRDAENRRCLPIKLFYYWAAGVMPIYSDLDAIRQHIPDAEEAMMLVKNEQEAVAALTRLMNDPMLVEQYRKKGMHLHQERYYWEHVEERLKAIL